MGYLPMSPFHHFSVVRSAIKKRLSLYPKMRSLTKLSSPLVFVSMAILVFIKPPRFVVLHASYSSQKQSLDTNGSSVVNRNNHQPIFCSGSSDSFADISVFPLPLYAPMVAANYGDAAVYVTSLLRNIASLNQLALITQPQMATSKEVLASSASKPRSAYTHQDSMSLTGASLLAMRPCSVIFDRNWKPNLCA